jgi:hypothetical protein
MQRLDGSMTLDERAKNLQIFRTVRAAPGRLSALRVSHSKSVFARRFCMSAQGA